MKLLKRFFKWFFQDPEKKKRDESIIRLGKILSQAKELPNIKDYEIK